MLSKHGSKRAAARAMGIPESTFRMRLVAQDNPIVIPRYGFVPDAASFPKPVLDHKGVEVRDFSSGKPQRFILTSAQNNTRVHGKFMKNLQAFANHVNAQLMVSYTLYDKQGYRGVVRKGESSLREHIWWDRAVAPYATNYRAKLAEDLMFCGELDILATAARPLASLDPYCRGASIVVPHCKFAMQCVEARRDDRPKEMFTTGSLTLPRFVQRKAGQVAAFHHVFGALLVEVQGNTWWVHHLNADYDTGEFYWLDTRVSNGKIYNAPNSIDTLILGDIHHEKATVDNLASALQVCEDAKPKVVVLHDIIDFTSRNHHNRNDPFFLHSQNGITIQDELCEAKKFLHAVSKTCERVVVARSNHDEALDKWLRETDWREDLVNAELYLGLASYKIKNPENNILEYAFGNQTDNARQYPFSATFLDMDESFVRHSIECGMHGHVGPSGSRGSPRSFSKLGFKSFVGHGHTPSINDGCYAVGVAGNIEMGYNRGPSKWAIVHGVIYRGGKRGFLWVKNNKIRM